MNDIKCQEGNSVHYKMNSNSFVDLMAVKFNFLPHTTTIIYSILICVVLCSIEIVLSTSACPLLQLICVTIGNCGSSETRHFLSEMRDKIGNLQVYLTYAANIHDDFKVCSAGLLSGS